MRRLILAIGFAFFALGAMAQSPKGQKEKALENYNRTGMRETCIPINGIKNTKILDDSSILFFMNGGTVYLNELPESCGVLNPYRSFKYTTSIEKVCNTDIITVFDAGSSVPRLGSCGLGQFERLEEKKQGNKPE